MTPRASLHLAVATVLVAMVAAIVAGGAAAAAVGASGGSHFKVDVDLKKPAYVSLSAATTDGDVMVHVDGDGDDELAALVTPAADGTVRIAAAAATTDDASSLESVAASRAVDANVINAIIRAVRSTSFSDNIVKIGTALATSIFRGRQTRFTYNSTLGRHRRHRQRPWRRRVLGAPVGRHLAEAGGEVGGGRGVGLTSICYTCTSCLP